MGGLKHTDVGQRLTKTEWEATTSHEIASASTGDILYHDGTGIVARAIGTSGQGLTVSTAGLPVWAAIAVSFDVPEAIAPDDAISSGTSTSAARSDHVHGISAGTAGTIGPQVTAAEGTSTGFARADHAHGSNSLAPTAIAPDATNAEGASTAFARATHTHGIAAAAPSGISVVTAGNEGNSTSFVRANHVHGLNHAITNNHLVTIDGTTNQPVNTDYAKFTALGLEGKTAAQMWADLSSQAAAAVGFNAQNITNVGTVDGVDVSDHDALHLYLGADQLSIRSHLAVYPHVLVDWQTHDGWTEAHTGTGSASFAVNDTRVATGTTINSIGKIYSGLQGFSYFQHPGYTANVMMSVDARSALANSVVYHGYWAATTPTDTDRHTGVKIINGQIWASTANGTTQEITDTGISIATLYDDVRVYIEVTASSVKLYINGVLKATHTTYLAGPGTLRGMMYLKTTDTTDKIFRSYLMSFASSATA